MRSARFGVITLDGQWIGSAWLPPHPSDRATPGVAMIERRRVLPSFPERVLEIADRGSTHLQLHVVPRRTRSVARGDRHCLHVTGMSGVVGTSMTQIDAACVGDVVIGSLGAPDDDQLLMVTAAPSDALIEQHLAAGGVQGLRESEVVLLGEVCPARV
jgi:hypothetical protein